MNETARRVIEEQCGFITQADVEGLSGDYPILEVLVRTGTNRYLCGLNQIDKVFAIVENKGDYVRDVSLPVHVCDAIRAGKAPRCRGSVLQRYPD